MNLPVRLRREAQREYDEATDWYESRRTGLGVRFVTALHRTMKTIEEQPDRYPEVWPGVREAIVLGWPHCVYYRVHADCAMVLAVFHSARDPSVWQGRV